MFNMYLKASKSEPELLISHTKPAPPVLFPGQLTGKLHCSRCLAKKSCGHSCVFSIGRSCWFFLQNTSRIQLLLTTCAPPSWGKLPSLAWIIAKIPNWPLYFHPCLPTVAVQYSSQWSYTVYVRLWLVKYSILLLSQSLPVVVKVLCDLTHPPTPPTLTCPSLSL